MTAAAPTGTASPRRRRRWSLQTKLMVTVIGFVSLILVAVGLASGAILSSALQQTLDQTLKSAGQSIPFRLGLTATDVLNGGRQPVGFLLVMQNVDGTISGAYVGQDAVETMSPDDIGHLITSIQESGPGAIHVDGLGEYQIRLQAQQNGSIFAIVGLPVSSVTSTLTPILTALVMVIVGGLLVLAAVLAVVIRASVRPLRVAADTATRVAALPLAEGAVSISERVPDDQTDDHTEIGRVGAALNTLLDHVDASLHERHRNEERMRRFVADASHELRTPLASIRGYSELSLRDPSLGDGTAQSLERIQAQSLRMTALVEDLLLLARLDEGQELVYGTVDLTRLAVEATGDAQVAGPDHRWVLDVDDEPVLIAGDAARLNQVVTNLLANARTHTPAGTTVSVDVVADGPDAVLRVHDDGPGIDPEVQAELFERFSRGDRSRDRRTGGTGLGLSIARAIVEAHGGRIEAESEPGDTTFTVRLPTRPVNAAPAPAAG